MPRSIASLAAWTIRAYWMRLAMRAAIRIAPPERRQIVMTIWSGSSKPSARSATRSRPNARGSPTRWRSTPPARASTSSLARAEERSRRSCAGSDLPERTPTRATAIWRATCRRSARAAASRVVIRSIWAYGSQARLLMWAIVAFVLAFVIRLLHGETALAAIGRLGTTRSSRSPTGLRRTAIGSTGRRRFCTSSAHWPSRSTCGARFGSRTFCCAARGCSPPRSANGAKTSTRAPLGSISASPR